MSAAAAAPVGGPFALAACAEMLFLDLPLEQRVARIAAHGLGVVLWAWAGRDLEALAATGARFSSMTGYTAGELVDEAGAAALLASAGESLRAAEALDCPRLNLHGTGLDARGLPVRPLPHPTGRDWLRALRTLERVAALGERAGRVFLLENLNAAVDHPGVPFARAEDTAALVEAVGSPHLRMNLDLYHAQIGEGNLVELLGRVLPLVGEVQVADVPGRCEPGTGEVAWPAVARALARHGWTGSVALEAWASGDPIDALDAFRAAFAVG